MTIAELLNAAIPAIIIVMGLVVTLLGFYAQRMRNRYDTMTDHETLFVGECPHVNSFGSPARCQGMSANPVSGDISAHSQSSISLIKAVS